MKKYLLSQLIQPSTWRGFVYIATASGLTVAPDQATAVISAGMAISGAIAAFFPD